MECLLKVAHLVTGFMIQGHCAAGLQHSWVRIGLRMLKLCKTLFGKHPLRGVINFFDRVFVLILGAKYRWRYM